MGTSVPLSADLGLLVQFLHEDWSPEDGKATSCLILGMAKSLGGRIRLLITLRKIWAIMGYPQ